jgi:threonine dehydrogenase-like Zn-dependent dehydrogenase
VLRDGRLDVREIADPVPGRGHLLIRTVATAICASDVHYMDHPEIAAGDETGMFGYDPDRDVVMGHEFVGEVVGHGPGVDAARFPLGARVTSIPLLLAADGAHIIGAHPDATGSFGELLLVSQEMARTVPKSVNADAVAVVDAFAVGEGYVRLARMETADVPLVVGAGAIGLSTVAALARRGVEPIVASDFNPERRELATTFGAHIVNDPAERSAHETWREVAKPGGRCVIFESVGAPGLIERLINECADSSMIVCAGGWYTGDTVSVTPATRKGLALQFGGAPGADDWYGTLDAVCDGRLDPLPSIGMVVGLDDVPKAIDMARRAEGPPRIVVHP